jgi:replicative DNA helicase
MDKIPPSNLEAELATLGSMMIEKDALLAGLEILSPEDFYRPANGEVFTALQAQAHSDEPADLITTQEELRRMGKLDEVGGTEYLMSLAEAVPTAANLKHYAGIVKEKSTLRKLIAAGTEIISKAHEPEATADSLVERLTEITLDVSGKSDSHLRTSLEIANSVLKQWESYIKGEKHWTVPFSLAPLNKLLKGGVSHGQLFVVGAGTSEGKTVILHDLMISAGRASVPTLCFSGEMSGEEIQTRMACMIARVDSEDLECGGLASDDYQRVFNAQATIAQYPLIIQDIAPTLNEFSVICKRWALQNVKDNKGLIVVDYGELIEFEGKNENEEIKKIYKALKAVARALKVPVATGAQIRKKPASINPVVIDPATLDEKNAPIPPLDELIGSSAIRNFADQVIMLLNKPEWPVDASNRRRCFFAVGKHRGGKLGRFSAWYTPIHTRFDAVDWRDDS